MCIVDNIVDDIFVMVDDVDKIEELRSVLEEKSIIKFTKECNKNNTLAFLDVMLDIRNEKLIKSVYVKPTDDGNCLKEESECPNRYKKSVCRYYVERAWKYSSNYDMLHKELERIKKVSVNNGYSNKDIDKEIKDRLQCKIEDKNGDKKESNNKPKVKIYYRNYMNEGYKVDERVLKDIISKGVKSKNDDKDIQLVIYYKSKKVRDFVMKNNCCPVLGDLQRSNFNYKFSCSTGDCENRMVNYIGRTQTTLSRRITMHLQSNESAIVKHFIDVHDRKPTRKELVKNIKIEKMYKDKRRLDVSEALLIRREKPILNIQDRGMSRKLLLFGV